MVEKLIFHKFHTNKKIISNTVLFATFKIFFNYKEIPTISFYNKKNYLEIREIVRGKILREKVILNEAGHLIISEKYPPITSPSTKIIRIKNRYFVKIKFKVRSVKIQKAFYISQKKSEIFYHAVNWVLPQIIFIGFFENTNAFKKILIIDKSLHKRIKDFLYSWIELESKNWKIVECSNQEILKVESLKIVSSKQTNLIATNLLSKNDAIYLRNKFKLLLDSKTSIPQAKRIFLKRDYDARSTIGRNLENAQQIEEFFLKNSFQIVDLAKFSFLDQIKIFTHAEVIAGVHGGHFSLLAFSKNLKVIEIFCGLRSNCFAKQCKVLGFSYHSIYARKAHKKYYLDLNKLESLFKSN